ncbi:MAG: PEP-CTERM sorting domain-containing protein [Planctomycetia bacterium]|nr:PEP-CTERM sorting domain-containing protein [Planctomycetia bacterium]
MLHKTLMLAAVAIAATAIASPADAQVRLIGMSGNQNASQTTTPHQEAFWDINIGDASSIEVGRALFSPDSQALGFNPVSGLLHRTGGGDAYSNNPQRMDSTSGLLIGGYADDHYMETFDPAVLTPGSQVPPSTAIYNANGPNLPADPLLARFGLPAPRPSWVLPVEPRTSAQTDASFRQTGENEMHAIRGLAWSASQSLFFVTSEEGIYTMTADGESDFLGAPRADFGDAKGLVILDIEGQERMFVGTKEQTGSDPFAGSELIEVDMTTGLEINSVLLRDPVLPDTLGATGILGMSVHPETGVLYAVSRGESTSDPYARELITIDPLTGNTTLIGLIGVNISSIAFTFPVVVDPDQEGDTNGDGAVTIEDLNNVRNNFGGAGLGDTVGSDDGQVTIEDLNNVRNNFGAGVAGANAVPEPSTALLALCGLAALGYRFRRK